jgi:hypothetical protein
VSTYTAGIDVGSTYTKAVVLGPDTIIAGRAMRPTGFQLSRVAEETLADAAAQAGIALEGVAYTVATGFGRHQVALGDVKVTDLTAAARGATLLFPNSEPVGQTLRLAGRGATLNIRIIGVLQSKGQSIVGSVDQAILVPLSYLQRTISQSKTITGQHIVNSIVISMTSPSVSRPERSRQGSTSRSSHEEP